MELKGIEEVINNLNSKLSEIKEISMKGLLQSAVLIRRDMDITPPLIPVDTGNLRNSWTVVPNREKIQVMMGFSTEYAASVHERTSPLVKWKRKGSGAKFFESALMRNTNNILETIKNNVEIKK